MTGRRYVITSVVLLCCVTVETKRSRHGESVASPVTPTTDADLSSETRGKSQLEENLMVESLHIRSDIIFRFATTHVTSRLANQAEVAKESHFRVTLPKAAFISNFSMTTAEGTYTGHVQAKAAKKRYDHAKNQGQSPGYVTQRYRRTNAFKVTVTVPPRSAVDFYLTYQEMLERRFSVYEHVINVDPGQVVPDMRVEVSIKETRPISDLRVPPMRKIINSFQVMEPTGENPLAHVRKTSRSAVFVSMTPSVEEQIAVSSQGIGGQFIVQYDVLRRLDAGEFQAADGYFVHHFSPIDLDPVDKNVLFILDVSGSMNGEKLRQTKSAMTTILDEMRPRDKFNIITFATQVSFWHGEGLLLASPHNKERAKGFIQSMTADGGTNFNDALLRAIGFLAQQEQLEPAATKASMMVFLTDGIPAAGISSPVRIANNIRIANKGRFTLFSLGFGDDLDFAFLQKMSLQNRGIARKIYTGSDANLQLEGFFNEVSTPLMTDVKMAYAGDSVFPESLTNSNFTTYYQGTELTVTGRLRGQASTVPVKVTGGSVRGFMSLDGEYRLARLERESTQIAPSNHVERMWAYLTIKRLLDSMLQTTVPEQRADAKAEALNMSLQYSFVTPLTSMVVTQPEGDADSDVDESETENTRNNYNGKGPAQGDKSSDIHRQASGPRRSGSFVDNDPHFMVHVEGLGEGVCFDVDGEIGSVYQLLHDKITGISVNGLIVGTSQDNVYQAAARTYIGQLALNYPSTSILITPHNIAINNITHSWKKNLVVDDVGLVIKVADKKHVDIIYNELVIFRVLRHYVKKPSSKKVSFLGFYVENGDGLSERTHGLIGQFLYQRGEVVNNLTGNTSNDIRHAVLRLRGPHSAHRTLKAWLGHRRNMEQATHVPCWRVGNGGAGLIKGHHSHYIVPSLAYNKSAGSYRKMTIKLDKVSKLLTSTWVSHKT